MATAAQSASLWRRLGGATLNYGLGQALPTLIGFLLIPVYTAFLSPEEYGVLDLAGSLSGVLILLMRFGVPGAVTRFYYEHREGAELSDYVTTVTWFVFLFSLSVAAVCLLGGRWLFPLLLPELPFYPFVVLVVIAAVLTGTSDVQRRLVQAREQSGYSARLSLATAAVNIGLALLFVVGMRRGATGMQAAYTIGAGLFFLQATRYLRPNLGGRFEPGMLRSSLAYGLGIIPGHLVGSLAPLVTRAVLARLGSVAAVGVFAIANRFASPLAMLSTALNAAYLPIYFSIRKEDSEEGRRRLARVGGAVWCAAALLSLGIAALGPPLIRIMTPTRFHAAAPLVPVLAVGFVFQTLYTIFAPEIFYSKKTWLAPVVALATAVVTVGATALLARGHGALGVAWAQNAGQVTTGAIAVVVSARLVRIPYDWLSFGRVTVVAGAGFLATRLIARNGNPWHEAALGGSVCVVTALVLIAAKDPTLAAGLRLLRRRA